MQFALFSTILLFFVTGSLRCGSFSVTPEPYDETYGSGVTENASFDNSQNPYVFTLKKNETLFKFFLILTMN